SRSAIDSGIAVGLQRDADALAAVHSQPLLQTAPLFDDDHRVAAYGEVAVVRLLIGCRDESRDCHLVAGPAQASEAQKNQRQREPREEKQSHVGMDCNADATRALLSSFLDMPRTLRSSPGAAAIAAATVALPSAQRDVPTPQSVLGWEPCADYKLATYEQIEDYFRKLAAAAPGRMKLVEM